MSHTPCLAVYPSAQARAGYIAVISALLWWGVTPIYFWVLRGTPPLEIFVHRIVWSFVSLSLVLCVVRPKAMRGGKREFTRALAPAALMSLNWLVFVSAIVTGNALQASLGYFLNPILVMGLAVLLLKERMNRARSLAFGFSLAGTLLHCILQRTLPLHALLLALTFSGVVLIRKKYSTDDILGTTWRELVLMLPVAAGVSLFLLFTKTETFSTESPWALPILMLAGPLTVVPVSLYMFGVPRVPLLDVGMLQYIPPTCYFLLSFLFFGEPIDARKVVGFLVLWIGLAIYSFDLLHQQRYPKPAC